MPVEIKELVIRAVVTNQAPLKPDSTDPEGPEGPEVSAAPQRPFAAEDRAAIISEAVREVLRILKTAKER